MPNNCRVGGIFSVDRSTLTEPPFVSVPEYSRLCSAFARPRSSPLTDWNSRGNEFSPPVASCPSYRSLSYEANQGAYSPRDYYDGINRARTVKGIFVREGRTETQRGFGRQLFSTRYTRQNCFQRRWNFLVALRKKGCLFRECPFIAGA